MHSHSRAGTFWIGGLLVHCFQLPKSKHRVHRHQFELEMSHQQCAKVFWHFFYASWILVLFLVADG